MGIGLLLDITRQSFGALDAAMNVAAENIANAESTGFRRRRISLVGAGGATAGSNRSTISTPMGGGVRVTGYERMRDAMLDRARWEARGSMAFAAEQERVMSTVEVLFPGGTGSLAGLLDRFWDGWADVSDRATDVGSRLALTGRTEALTRKLKDLDRSLSRMESETKITLADSVKEANDLLTSVADANVRIANARRAGSPDFGSEDARDMSIQRLSELLPTRIEEMEDGSTSVYIRGINVVQLAYVTPLVFDPKGSPLQVGFGDTGVALSESTDSGEIGALLHPITTGIANARGKLDAMASALVTEVNALHKAGSGLDGVSGRDFFTATGLSAGTISIASGITSDPTTIAASGSTAAAGDNSQALAIQDLRYKTMMTSGQQTLADFTVDVGSEVGASVASARARALGSESTIAGLDAMAEGISGVSIDDEMIGLIKLQQAFAATAKLLQTADEMFSTLLSI